MVVTDQLSVPSLERVFVIGDTARVLDSEGNQVPGIAPAAKQQGRHVAKWIRGDIQGKPLQKPYRYRHTVNLATIGRRAAVIEFPKFRLKGFLAWWVWGVAHIYFLIGVRSPLLVSCRCSGNTSPTDAVPV